MCDNIGAGAVPATNGVTKMKTWYYIVRHDNKQGEEIARGNVRAHSKQDALSMIIDEHGVGNHISVWR